MSVPIITPLPPGHNSRFQLFETSDGRLGSGVPNPTARIEIQSPRDYGNTTLTTHESALDIHGNADEYPRLTLDASGGTVANQSAILVLSRQRGTSEVPTGLTAGDIVGRIWANGYHGITNAVGSVVRLDFTHVGNTASGPVGEWSVAVANGAGLQTLTTMLRVNAIGVSLFGGVYANGVLGTAGQVLTTNGSAIYWQDGAFSGANLTFVTTGLGGSNNTIYDGLDDQIISYNTIGAPAANGTGATGTWTISITGTANNTTYFNGQSASYYINASNITTGVLPIAQVPTTFITPLTVNGLVIQTAAALFAGGTSGTDGQVLTTNGSAVYWSDVEVGGGVTTTFGITFNDSGVGDVSPTSFNGSAARIISFNTIGAPSTTGTGASGLWAIAVQQATSTLNSLGIFATANVALTTAGLRVNNAVGNVVVGAESITVQSSANVATVNTTTVAVGTSQLSTVMLHVGSSTANSTINATTIQVANTTNATIITATSMGLGVTAINTTSVKLQSGLGNTTVTSVDAQIYSGSNQLRFGYSPSVYTNFSVNSVGGLTWTGAGSSSRVHLDNMNLSVGTTGKISFNLGEAAYLSEFSSNTLGMWVGGHRVMSWSPTSSVANSQLISNGYTSRTTGWGIEVTGEADFRQLYTDEFYTRSMIVDLEQTLAGGQIIAKSVARLYDGFVVPAKGDAEYLFVEDLPSAADMQVFQSGDWVILRQFTRSGGELTAADCVGVVTDPDTSFSGYQRWTFSRATGAAGGTMTTGVTIPTGSLVIDYGTSGNGFYEVSAVDGANAENAPYSQIATWTDYPQNKTVRVRLGNLKGITSQANEFGLLAGTYAGSGGSYLRATNQAFELHNIDLTMWEGTTEIFHVKRGGATPYLALGNPVPSSYTVGTGLWMGKDSSVYKFRVGNPSGTRLQWDGTTLKLGNPNQQYLDANGTHITFYQSSDDYGSMSSSTWRLGKTTQQHILLTPNLMTFKSDSTTTAGLLTGTEWTLGVSGGKQAVINSTGVLLRDAGTTYAQFAATTIIGQVASGQSNVLISSGAIELRNNTTTRIKLNTDGSGYLASTDISWAANGYVTMIGATIGGWQVRSGRIDYDTGTATTSVGLSATDYPFYAGQTYAGRASAPFRVTPNGALYSSNATITGTVTANSGAIAAWTISGNRLQTGSGTSFVALDGASGSIRIWAGDETATSAPFRVYANGYMWASSVAMSGSVTASEGSVGGWTINSTALYAGTGASSVGMKSDGSYPFYAGHGTPSSAPFRVTAAGALTATNATITGTITAESGSVNGSFTIGSTGYIASAGTTFGTGVGVIMGYDGAYKFRVGNLSGQHINWDGSDLYIQGTGYSLTSTDGLTFNYPFGDDASARINWGSSGAYISANYGGSSRLSLVGPVDSSRWSQMNLYRDVIYWWVDTLGGGAEPSLLLTSSTLEPGTDEGISLGTASKRFSDLYVEPPYADTSEYPLVVNAGRVYLKDNGVDGTIGACAYGTTLELTVHKGLIVGWDCVSWGP